ncbi:hypothetical protein [Alteromonas gracilis]|uniref:hypothetical protein n=1 Tax=Alteromonas gracilis TaxID=1479524 RepID=UPI003735B49B
MLEKQQEALLTMNNTGVNSLFDEVTALDEVAMDDMFIIVASALNKLDSIEIMERKKDGVTGLRASSGEQTLFDVYPEPYEHNSKDKWGEGNKVSHFRLMKVHHGVEIKREMLDVYSQVNPQKYMPTGSGVMIYEDVMLNYGRSIEELVDVISRFYRNSLALVTAKYMQTTSMN